MELIVEDGSGVVGANSYVSADDYLTWAAARGLPELEQEQVEIAAVQAVDYLQIEVCYSGYRVDEEQALEYPRTSVYINGVLFADDAVPSQLKQAQMHLMSAVLSGVPLMPNVSGNAADYVVKEKVGPIETTFADATVFNGRTSFTAVERLLAPLLGRNCTGFGSFNVVRG